MENCAEARAKQMEQRAAHLEADVAILQKRKAELEKENEDLAAAAARQPELERQLAEAVATTARLEAECQSHRVEAARKASLERQQAEIAVSFRELQAVVSQLAKRLGEMDFQLARVTVEKNSAKASYATLRAELDRLRGAAKPSVTAKAKAAAAQRGPIPLLSKSDQPFLAAPGSVKAAATLYGRSSSCESCGSSATRRLRCQGTPGFSRTTPGRRIGVVSRPGSATALNGIRARPAKDEPKTEPHSKERQASDADMGEVQKSAPSRDVVGEIMEVLAAWPADEVPTGQMPPAFSGSQASTKLMEPVTVSATALGVLAMEPVAAAAGTRLWAVSS